MLSDFKFNISFDCCLAEMSEHCLIFLSEVSFGFVRCHRKTEPKKPTFSVSVFGFLEDRSVLYIKEPNFTQIKNPTRTEPKTECPVLIILQEEVLNEKVEYDGNGQELNKVTEFLTVARVKTGFTSSHY